MSRRSVVTSVAIPPDPRSLPPITTLEAHFEGSYPVRTESLCPQDVACVVGGGAGIGASLEWRWASGLGVFGAYDIWFLDSNSVFELGVQQAILGGARYVPPGATRVHPLLEMSGGFMVLGDTFGLSSVGFVLQSSGGVEVELTQRLGILVGTTLRVYSHTQFYTERDGVPRGAEGALSVSLALRGGLIFIY